MRPAHKIQPPAEKRDAIKCDLMVDVVLVVRVLAFRTACCCTPLLLEKTCFSLKSFFFLKERGRHAQTRDGRNPNPSLYVSFIIDDYRDVKKKETGRT